MARKQEQEALPGIPAPPKRKIIKPIESLCEKREKLEGERSNINDELDEVNAKIQDGLVENGIKIYTYEDGKGVMQDILLEDVIRRRRSKVQPNAKPKKPTGGDE